MPTYLVLGVGGKNKSPAYYEDYLQAMEYAHGLQAAGFAVKVYLETVSLEPVVHE